MQFAWKSALVLSNRNFLLPILKQLKFRIDVKPRKRSVSEKTRARRHDRPISPRYEFFFKTPMPKRRQVSIARCNIAAASFPIRHGVFGKREASPLLAVKAFNVIVG